MRWVARGSAVVLRVAGGELAVARSRMDQCAVALGGVHLDRGSQGVFGAGRLQLGAAAGAAAGGTGWEGLR